MDQELYIDDDLIDLGQDSVIAYTLQINDVANLESRNGNFTNQIAVPFTQRNRKSFANANSALSSSEKPYTKLPVKFIDGGMELIPAGYATLDTSDDNYEITIYAGNSDIFALIDGLKLSDLDLSDLDHDWTLANILASNANTSGYIYPLIDYSNRVVTANISQKVYKDSLYPALFVHTLIERIFSSKGWTIEGDILTDDRYLNAIMALSQKFQNPNTFFDIVNGQKTSYVDTTALNSLAYNKMKYVVDVTGTIGQWYNFNTLSGLTHENSSPLINLIDQNHFLANTWTSPTTILININYDIELTYKTGPVKGSGSTSTGLLLKIYNKTQNVFLGGTLDYQPSQGYLINQNSSGTFTYVNDISLDAHQNVNTGDELVFFLYSTGTPGFEIDITMTKASITIEPESTINDGAKIYMTYQVPDMAQTDFLKAIMNVFCITPDADSSTKTCRFRAFKELIDNMDKPKDWSSKYVQQKPTVTYRFGNYYQVNDFIYKQDYNLPILFGNGNFTIDDENLTVRGNVVELPFGSSIESLQSCIKANGDVQYMPDIDLSKNSLSTRIFILRRTDVPEGLIYNYLTTNTTENLQLPFCHFALSGFKGLHYQELLTDYWDIISAIVNKSKFITVQMNLKTTDVYNFDFFVPVYIEQLSNYFYVNKISNYKRGQLTTVELVRIDASSIFKPVVPPPDFAYRTHKNGDVHRWKNNDLSTFKQ